MMNSEYKDLITTNQRLEQQVEALTRQLRETENRYQLISKATNDVVWKEAYDALSDAYQFLIDSIPQMVWRAFSDGKADYFNHRWCEYTGLSMEESIEQGWLKMLHPDDIQASVNTWRKSIQAGNAFQQEYRLRGHDGSYRWFLGQALPLCDKEGNIIKWFGSCTDIHDQREAQEALVVSQKKEKLAYKQIEQNEEMLQMALKAGNMATFSLDIQTGQTVRSINHDRIFGYEENLPTWNLDNFLQHVLPEDLKSAVNLLNQSLKDGEITLELRILRTDNKIRWIGAQGKVFYDDHKQPVHVSGVIRDITKQKEAEQQLQEMSMHLIQVNEELATANEDIKFTNDELNYVNNQLQHINTDLDNFIYAASHDLKAPISNIEGLMKLLIRKMPPETMQNAQVHRVITMIQDSIERFKNTIADLSEVTKLQKQISIPADRIKLSEVIEDVLLDIEPMIEDTHALIEYDLRGCPAVPFSKKNMRSVVYNLLSNAIKYRSPDRGIHVRVFYEQTDKFLMLSVVDNGLGMDLSDGHKLFTMFSRLHDHVEGTGIGLYMVKKIMENAGGKIEVQSQLNVGSTFHVYFAL